MAERRRQIVRMPATKQPHLQKKRLKQTPRTAKGIDRRKSK